DGAKAAIPGAQSKVTAKDTTLKALAEAAAKIKAAADAAKNDPALVAEFQAAQKLVATATADLEAAKKAVADATTAMNAASAKFAETEKALTAAKATAAAAPKAVEARTAEVKAATDKYNAAQGALGPATNALLDATREALENYKAMPPKK